MNQFNWSILETFGDGTTITKVRYFVKATDETNFVESEGYHSFSEGVVCKPFEEIKEEDLIRWLDQDTTKDEVNIIKLNLENQLKALKENNKVDFPWETNTFTIS